MASRTARLIQRHEGLRLKPYKDTVGKLTIGYGRNLEDRGISQLEAEQLFKHDLAEHKRELLERWPWVSSLGPVREAVFVDMAFNLGIGGLAKFRRFIAAAERRDFRAAASEMMDSRWATQVKGRARRLARMMRSGQWPPELRT